MAWEDGDIASALIKLETAERSVASGDFSDMVRRMAIAAYNSAAANEQRTRANWKHEIMARAQHVIDQCNMR